jgi:DNA-binding beta-propeller fold protein YncE
MRVKIGVLLLLLLSASLPASSNIGSPFQSTGPTVLLGVTASSQQVLVAQAGTLKVPSQVMVANLSTNVVYIAFGSTTGVTAAIPVGGTPALGIPIPPSAVEVFSTPGGDATGTYVAAIAAVAGPSNVTFTPGEGN